MDWLQQELQKESDGTSRQPSGRGLKQDVNPEGDYVVQTFQIYIPVSLRHDLSKCNNEIAPIVTEIEPSAKEKKRRQKKQIEDGKRSPKEIDPLNPSDGPPSSMSHEEYSIR